MALLTGAAQYKNVLFVYIGFLKDAIFIIHVWDKMSQLPQYPSAFLPEKEINGKGQLTFPKLPFPIALRIWKWSKFTMRKQSRTPPPTVRDMKWHTQ